MAKNLKPGDVLITANGEEKKVVSVENYLAKEPEAIYNLNVNEYHTYFVSNMSVLVHNIGCTPEQVAEFAKTLKETGNSEVDTLVKDGSETSYVKSSEIVEEAGEIGKTSARDFAKSKGVPSTLTDEEAASADLCDLQMNMKKIDDSYLKQNGIDAHELKSDFVGNRNISRYDLYVDTDTGEVHIFLKGGKGEGIATGDYIK